MFKTKFIDFFEFCFKNYSMKKIFSIFLCLVFAGIFAFADENISSKRKMVSSQRQALISYALKFQGVPYRIGEYTDPSRGFDCSGFVFYVARLFPDPSGESHQLPRTSKAMYAKCEKIDALEKEPGDLVFFGNDKGVNHVGIYCGVYHNSKNPNTKFENKRVFVSCISDGPRTGVVLELMDADYWKKHLYAYGRFLPSTQEFNAKYKN